MSLEPYETTFPVEKQLVFKCPRCGLEQMLLKETARIRELEAEKGKWEILAKSARNRIAKAKAILHSPIDWPEPYKLIKNALTALEGNDQEATTPLVRPDEE